MVECSVLRKIMESPLLSNQCHKILSGCCYFYKLAELLDRAVVLPDLLGTTMEQQDLPEVGF